MIINKEINTENTMKVNARVQRFSAFLMMLTLLSCLLVFPQKIRAQDSIRLVYKIDIKDEINPGLARMVRKGMEQATLLKADLILLHINTYGGMLDAADSIRTSILNLPIPVVAFIDNNAASAGALISIACNRIYMREGASMGAATVVDGNAQVLPDKYQSYMRSMMRSTAAKRGRDPRIAEAMVDSRTYIPGVNDSGKVLTFTTGEAIQNKYCEGRAESVDEVLKFENATHAELKSYEPSWIDRLIAFLIHPAVSGILLMLILGGIYFELQAPGIGFPLVVAVTAAIAYFAPLYLEGMAENWEVLLALIGLVLLALEIFVIPGFGIAGISGLVLLIAAFTLSMVDNRGFDFQGVAPEAILRSLSIVVIAVVTGTILVFISAGRIMHSKRFAAMVLKDEMKATDGFVSTGTDFRDLLNREGVTTSYLRPSGKIEINGISYSAQAETGLIESGRKIVVVRVEGSVIWVRETENNQI